MNFIEFAGGDGDEYRQEIVKYDPQTSESL
jgi:hypothetical protein